MMCSCVEPTELHGYALDAEFYNNILSCALYSVIYTMYGYWHMLVYSYICILFSLPNGYALNADNICDLAQTSV